MQSAPKSTLKSKPRPKRHTPMPPLKPKKLKPTPTPRPEKLISTTKDYKPKKTAGAFDDNYVEYKVKVMNN